MRTVCNTFTRDERGAVAIIAGVLITTLLGFGAVALDLSSRYAIHGQLQVAAEAAALAASQQLPDTAAATTAGLNIASKNTPTSYGAAIQASDFTYGTYDSATKTFTAGGTSPNAVQVTAARSAARSNAPKMFLAAVTGASNQGIQASAIANRISNLPPNCVYALNPNNAVAALSVSGGGNFSVPNCGVQVNSTHSKAAQSSGASSVTAKSFCITGGYQGSFTALPTTGCPAVSDPLASVPEPTTGTCYTGSSPDPIPGMTYCGTITIGTAKTWPAGEYYFRGATVTITGDVTGNGVMWYFDSTSTLDFKTNGTVKLTAPSSGTYKGIAIFQSRSAPLGNIMKITGSTDFLLDGTLYMPRAQLSLTGNSLVSVTGKTGFVIAYELHYTGTSDFKVGTWGGAQALGTQSPPRLVQ